MECINSPLLFRMPAGEKSLEKLKYLVTDGMALEKPGKESYLLCQQCRQIITSISEMIEVSGCHQHTFANPEGIIFEIGCFKKAWGCGYVGPATEEFTWFKGFHWKVAVCSHCLIYLGWLYIASGNESFHGLILDRLVRSPEDD
jgi:hypothetical protein